MKMICKILSFALIGSLLCAGAQAQLLTFSDDFESYDDGENFPAATPAWGNTPPNTNQGTIAAGGTFGQYLDAASGEEWSPLVSGLANHGGRLALEEQFKVSVKLQYTDDAHWGGIVLRDNDNNKHAVFMPLGTGTSGASKGLLLGTQANFGGHSFDTSMASNIDDYVDTEGTVAQVNTWYEMTIRGQQGVASVSVDLFDLGASSYLAQNITLDLDVGPAVQTRFGVIAHNSGAYNFDDYSQAIPEPSTYALMFGIACLAFIAVRRRWA